MKNKKVSKKKVAKKVSKKKSIFSKKFIKECLASGFDPRALESLCHIYTESCK